MELLFTLVILGFLAVIGIPNFFGSMQNARIISQTNQTLGLIAYARSEAAKRPGTTITVCASKTTQSATPSCDTTEWEHGWIVFSDINNDQAINSFNEDENGNSSLDIGEDRNSNGTLDTVSDELLKIGEALSDGNTLRMSGFSNAGSGFLTFDSNGLPDSAGTFTICDERGTSHAKAVALTVIGHARLATDDSNPADGIVDDNTGVNVVCP